MRVIYADTLFLINFIINYLILFASGHMACIRIKRLRLGFSAAFGALYSVFSFIFPSFSFFLSKALLCVAMVLIAFGFDKLLFIKSFLSFFAMSLAFGGAAFFAASFFSVGSFSLSDGVYYINLPAHILLLCAAAAYLLLSLIFRGSAGKSARKICKVKIEGAESFTLSALQDTGNSLRAPGTNAPVVISDYVHLRAALPPRAREILDSAKEKNLLFSLPELSELPSFRLLPYRTLSSDFSLLLAFRPLAVSIDGKRYRDALIAICNEPVCETNAYSALV